MNCTREITKSSTYSEVKLRKSPLILLSEVETRFIQKRRKIGLLQMTINVFKPLSPVGDFTILNHLEPF